MDNKFGKAAYRWMHEKLEGQNGKTRHHLSFLFCKMLMAYGEYGHTGEGVILTNRTEYQIIKDLGRISHKARHYGYFRLFAELGVMSKTEGGLVALQGCSSFLPPPKVSPALAKLSEASRAVIKKLELSLAAKSETETALEFSFDLIANYYRAFRGYDVNKAEYIAEMMSKKITAEWRALKRVLVSVEADELDKDRAREQLTAMNELANERDGYITDAGEYVPGPYQETTDELYLVLNPQLKVQMEKAYGIQRRAA